MSPSASDLSIITVNWNGRRHLEKLLPSLMPLGAGEILLVDNASSDDSVAFVQRNFPQVRLLRNETNRGFAQPVNLAAAEAEGNVLALINNDMRADARWLSAAMPHLTGERPCVASRILNWEGDRFDYNGSSLHYLGYAVQKDIGEIAVSGGEVSPVLFACGGAMLIDRKVFLEVGGFDEAFFAIYEDVDLGWRLWSAGYKVVLVPDSVVYHRQHATFSAQPNRKTRYLMHRNALLTIFKNYEDEWFQKIFPMAVVMAIRRAVHFSGVHKESFYMWEDVESALENADSVKVSQLTDALNHLVAVEDVLDQLPDWMAKRKKVQDLRKRPDSEIVKLFGDPFRQIVQVGEYREAESKWLQWLDLSRHFQQEVRNGAVSHLPSELSERIERLRHELKGLQWVQGQALASPPRPGRSSKLRKFLTVLKRGFRIAGYEFRKRVWKKGGRD